MVGSNASCAHILFILILFILIPFILFVIFILILFFENGGFDAYCANTLIVFIETCSDHHQPDLIIKVLQQSLTRIIIATGHHHVFSSSILMVISLSGGLIRGMLRGGGWMSRIYQSKHQRVDADALDWQWSIVIREALVSQKRSF